MTEYMILRSAEDGSYNWAEMGVQAARSAPAALKAMAEKVGADVPRDKFVAVPARSWKPVTVKVETKTALRFS
jgi:hypothetical protein